MATARNYSNTASQAQVSAAIAAADTSITLTDFTGYPAAPFTAALARGTANEEIVLVTAVASNTVTVTRGYDSTTAKAQGAGTTFQEVAVALDFRDANSHVVATAGVHGVTGSVVGTTDVQTLTNKTLTSPSSSNPTDTGTSTIATASITTLNVSGVSTLAGLTATTGSFSSTLAVTGTSTFTGLLSANGGITVPTGKRVTLTDLPTATTDAANKAYADALGVSAPTVSTIVRRDAAGRTQAVDPAAAADVATKGYVDGKATGGMARAVLRQTAAQTGLTLNAWSTITFQTADKDTATGWSSSTNPTRWTCPAGQGGDYLVSGRVQVGGSVDLAVRITKNGVVLPGYSTGEAPWTGSASAGGSITGMKLITLAATDYIELQGFVSTGSGSWGTSVFSDGASHLTIARIA